MFTLHAKQSEVALDLHRFRVLCWGRRGGKTELAIDQMKARLTIPNSRVVYIAPTFQQARDIAWEPLRKGLMNAGKPNEARLEIDLINGSKISLKGWEAIETLRGQHFDLIVMDEVAMFRNFWLNWHEVIRPTLTDTKGEAMFISTPKGFNHFYDLFNLQAKDSDFKSFHATTYDNPYIPSEEVDKAKRELTDDRFHQEYMADFRKSEGLVYKEFNRFRHVFKNDLRENTVVKTFGGVDFGYTNPCAVISIKKDKWANYWVTDEWYKTGNTDAQIADYVHALKWEECYPDPESPAAIKELKDRGVNIREVVKNKDSIKNGISVIRELFNTNRLRVHESCLNLIWELEAYSYPESRPDRNEDENPIKENDHALDALRYALSMDNALTAERYYPPEIEIITEADSYNPAE
jgi:PBSX family phage terminase large subunit